MMYEVNMNRNVILTVPYTPTVNSCRPAGASASLIERHSSDALARIGGQQNLPLPVCVEALRGQEEAGPKDCS
jgi:hypothetical protein